MATWAIQYGVSTRILTENEVMLLSGFFESLCTVMGTRHVTTTSYLPQKNGQVERFNKAIAT